MSAITFEKFPIGTWGHFPYDMDEMTEAEVKGMAECGFTLMHSPNLTAATPTDAVLPGLDLCEKYGIRMILRDWTLHWHRFGEIGEEAYRAAVRGEYEKYGRHHAVAGFFLGDEPRESELADCAKAYRVAKEEAPGMILHINQNPGFAQKCGTFLKDSGCNLLSFDRYSQMNPDPAGTRDFIRDLAENGALAQKMDIPLLTVMLSVGHFRYRVPDVDDLRWQMGAALALGSKGIFWYNYYNDIRDANYRGAPVTEFYDKTPTYYAMKTVHLRFNRDYAEIFNRSVHRGAMSIGQGYPALEMFNPTSPLLGEFHLLHASSADGTAGIVAFLEGKDVYAGKKYVMMLNNTPDTPAQFRLECPPDRRPKRVFQDVEEDFLTNHNDAGVRVDPDRTICSFWLAPGQFELFRFE